MLVSFSVGNYLSFNNKQTLSLVPDALKEHPGNLHAAFFYNSGDKFLKSVAIYGHNSHGKSNFIKSFEFLRNFAFNSFIIGQTNSGIDITPFRLSSFTINKPSFFEITFLIKETKYRYRVQLTSRGIVEEGLYYAESRIRENYLFERIDQSFRISRAWNRDADGRIEPLTTFAKTNILFLSVLFSQENIPRVQEVSKWLLSNVVIPDDYMKELSKARAIYSDLNYRSLILKFIGISDLGFTSIFDKIDNSNQSKIKLEKGLLNIWYESEIKTFDLYTKHNVFDENGKIVDTIEFELLKNESTGSVKYFIVACLLAYAIENSLVIWIDELDSKFHSDLLELLVMSFHDPSINAINSQMIFTTHNTILMDNKLRRDQMLSITKNERGESIIERMHTSEKPIKTGKSVEKEYRKGLLPGVSKKIKGNLGPTLFD